MTAIAGYWCRGGDTHPAQACRLLLAGQLAFGPDGENLASMGEVTLGSALHRTLPEDIFDRQPLSGAGGKALLCADARIDNREELADHFRLARKTLQRLADTDLLLKSWEFWADEFANHVLGDFALAIWDDRQRQLTLYRSPLSLKSLFYHVAPRFVAFASMPQGLLALPVIPKKLNFDHVASLSAGGFFTGIKTTMFEGIMPVQPGQAVRFDNGGYRAFSISDFKMKSGSGLSLTQAGEELRHHLDRAVTAQSRRMDGPLASHLSSGRDSSAVTTSAANSLPDGEAPLLAFTAAPRQLFSDGIQSSRRFDESDLAAQTARQYGTKISHVICRPKPFALGQLLDDLHRHHYGPLLNPSNLAWWAQISQAAADRQAMVLLAATAGNFSVSAGGSFAINDVLTEKGLREWWRVSRRIAGTSADRWLTVVDRSLGPRLPSRLYAAIRKFAGRYQPGMHDFPALRQSLKKRTVEISRDRFGDLRPPASYRETLLRMAAELDNSERMSLACWGVDIRDPTSDRRLVDFILSLPADMLAAPESRRPLYEVAFAGRVPPPVLRPDRRGYQAADWHEIFAPEVVRAEFMRYQRNSIVRELVDFSSVNRLIDAWPTDRESDLPTIDAYRNKLLGTLALASFTDIYFPD